EVAVENGVADEIGLESCVGAISGTRELSKQDMVHNSYCPDVSVDSETFEVTADGETLTCEPADDIPLTQKYTL
ncbi:MAG: urease subunit alpha, partial [Halobacteria archaeon]|nr:urease subunit alpha [Halobacteria archaeon]